MEIVLYPDSLVHPVQTEEFPMEHEGTTPLVMLASGQSIRMQKVMLFDEGRVKELAQLRAQAMKNLGGITTGIGFIGSPAWALGGAAALGLLEGMLSSSARKQAADTLATVEWKSGALARDGVLFSCNEISGIRSPYPHAWSAVDNTTRKRHVHAGDEFAHIEADDLGMLSVRWTHVVAYAHPKVSQSARFPSSDSAPRGTALDRLERAGPLRAIRFGSVELTSWQQATGDQVYRGIKYSILPDFSIEVRTSAQAWNWPSLHDFRQEIDELLMREWGKPL